jgi:hypothetical protein
MKKLLLILNAVLVCSSMLSCQNYIKMHEKFEWEPGHSAPKNYPMEIYRIQFIYADNSAISWPTPVAGIGADKWGRDAGGVSVGADQKPIPVGLNITWLSYAENQFYTGSFKLPYDTMLELFKKGWTDTDGFGTYDHIIVGMAPGGIVEVWLSGAAHTVDVARFQATKTTMNMKDFAPDAFTDDQKKYVQQIMEDTAVEENLAKNGISYGLWDKYRQRFLLRPKIVYDWVSPLKTEQILLNYYNGEAEVISPEMIEKSEYGSRARPQKMLFYWYVDWGGKHQGYQLPIEFNEAEIMKAFTEVYGANYNPENKTEGDLIVEVNRGNDSFRVFLQDNSKKVELLQSTGEIYLIN